MFRKKNIFLLSVVFEILSFSFSEAAPIPVSKMKVDFGGYEGCFVLRNLSNNQTIAFNQEACRKRTKPCSTFKIPNSLIALQTRVITPTTIVKWDGKKKFFRAWEKNHNLKSALQVSAVPFYQETSRRVGLKKMKNWVDALNYGNMNIGQQVDQFWLAGPLAISGFEQVQFLTDLYKNRLPVDSKNMNVVKELLVKKTGQNSVFSGKTGSDYENGKYRLGWFVGHLKSGQDEYVFATRIEGEGARGPVAQKMTEDFLRQANLISKSLF